MKNRFKLSLFIGGIIVLLVFSIFINSYFFFNIFTYKKDEISYLPWSEYKNPLTLKYLVLTDSGWEEKEIRDNKEIRFIFTELKEGHINYEEVDSSFSEKNITIRRADGAILLTVDYIGSNQILLKHNQKKLEVSEELAELIEKRFMEVSNE